MILFLHPNETRIQRTGEILSLITCLLTALVLVLVLVQVFLAIGYTIAIGLERRRGGGDGG